MKIDIGGFLLRTKQEIRYLGVQLDNCRKFGVHFEKVCGKADALMGALRSLLLNVEEPTGSVRRLFYGVWESVQSAIAEEE